MKKILIGRSKNCDFLIDDMDIEPCQATLYVYTFGKMEIVDWSRSGTFVNGVRIKSETRMPVTRKNVIEFAGKYKLDWTRIPNPLYKVCFYIAATIVAIVAIVLLLLFIPESAPFSSTATETESLEGKENSEAFLKENSEESSSTLPKEEETVSSMKIPTAEDLWKGSGRELNKSSNLNKVHSTDDFQRVKLIPEPPEGEGIATDNTPVYIEIDEMTESDTSCLNVLN